MRVSQAELEVLREACGVEEELSEEERAEKEAVCDEITGSWTGTIGAVIFLIIWGLVSFAGVVTILILCAMPGTRGPNRYGPDPLQPDSGAGGGYGYAPSSAPYAPTSSSGSYVESSSGAGLPDSLSEPEPGGRQFCTQCGIQLQPGARFCTVCGTAV